MTARYSNYHSHSPLMISPLFPARKLKGRYQQSHNTNYTQNHQRGCHSNCFGVTFLFMVMQSPQKSNRSNNCPHLPNSTRNAMTCCSKSSWKKFSRHNKNGSVWTKIGEEKCEPIEDHSSNASTPISQIPLEKPLVAISLPTTKAISSNISIFLFRNCAWLGCKEKK